MSHLVQLPHFKIGMNVSGKQFGHLGKSRLIAAATAHTEHLIVGAIEIFKMFLNFKVVASQAFDKSQHRPNRIKPLVFCLAFYLVAVPAFADQCVEATWSSGTTYTASITATTGNLLAVGSETESIDPAGTNITGVADTVNTYTAIDSSNGLDAGLDWYVQTFYAKNITGGSLTVTITLNNSSPVQGRAVICEFTGRDTTAPLDVHTIGAKQVTPGPGTDAITSGSVTTTAIDKVFGFGAAIGADGGLTAGTGYTSGNTNANGWGKGEYLTQSGSGAVAATFTSVNGTVRSYVTAIATFKPVSAASTKSIIIGGGLF